MCNYLDEKLPTTLEDIVLWALEHSTAKHSYKDRMRAHTRILHNQSNAAEDLIDIRKQEIDTWVEHIKTQWPDLVVVTETNYIFSTHIAGVHVYDRHRFQM